MSVLLDPDLSFEEGPHLYRHKGKVVPNVTRLLQHLHSFAGVPLEILEAAQTRGRMVHTACEYYDQGDLDETHSWVQPYLGYVEGWKAFVRDYAPNWSGVEELGYSKRFGFAGTLDRRGHFERGPARTRGRRNVLDVKTSTTAHWCWGVQTAAYRQLLLEHDPAWALADRYTVQLSSDGRYFLIPWNEPDDWATFQSLVQLHYKVLRHDPATANPAG